MLLEPIMSVEVISPDDTLGAVIGDLNSRRGKVQGVVPQANGQTIKALVPMSEMLSYAPTLNSLTSGRGMYTMEFYGYEDVPSHLAQKIIQERARATRTRQPEPERKINVQKRHPFQRDTGRVRNPAEIAVCLHRRVGEGGIPP